MQVRIRRLVPHIPMPEYKSAGASGVDLMYAGAQRVAVRPGKPEVLPTGIAIELPHGYEAQVRSRSGWAARFGVTVANSPGTIDRDYRGQIMVILLNTGNGVVWIEPMDRIAQLVFCPVMRAELVEAQELSETERGSGGLGSTGLGDEARRGQVKETS